MRFLRRFFTSPRHVTSPTILRLVTLEDRNTPVSLQGFLISRMNYVSTSFDGTSRSVINDTERTGPIDPGTNPPPTQPTLDLATASDTGAIGDRITDQATVTLNGVTSPNTVVQLLPSAAQTTSDATGAFSFTGVSLAIGDNAVTAQAISAGGATSQFATSFRRNNAPTVSAAIAAVNLSAGTASTLDLAGNFDDADITNSRVRFNTSGGAINLELFDRQAPRTVANFLNYVADGDYDGSIFHRSAELLNGDPFVLQGGGFRFVAQPQPALQAIRTDPAVQNEPDAVNRSNIRGTLAMAKLGNNANSATNQFFFNLGDNSANLDSQNGGFTVFGRTVGIDDLDVVDDLAATPVQDQSQAPNLPVGQLGVFSEIPLNDYNGSAFPTDTTVDNYVRIVTAEIIQRTEQLTYSVVGNSNPTLITTTVTSNRVTVQASAGQSGTAVLTIRATDRSGSFVESTVSITVTP